MGWVSIYYELSIIRGRCGGGVLGVHLIRVATESVGFICVERR